MFESTQDNINNPDVSITSVPTRFPYVPATPEPSPQNPVVSKDITVNRSKSTWMRLYVPTAALNGGVSSEKLPLVVYYHGGGFATGSVDFYPHHDFCNLMARELNAVFASPSYRLAPVNRLPAAYDDGVDAPAVFADLSPLRIRGMILHQPFFGGEERCESETNVNFPHILSDACWHLCLPVGANRDHEYSNPTVGDGPKQMEKIGRLGRNWKVVVIGRERHRLIDRHRDVAKLMKDQGVDVTEHFTDGDVHGAELVNQGETTLACIRSIIYSSSP
ncbi:probable carboxylesterase 120 [Brassica napus]|uniref:probable carboxylesterase 120 n=1 Tax=Brassica napus TaxID=3708 RepID=UPI002078C1CD|nr:probable carboxylesterase 120 [Brassica napus]